MGIYQAGDIVHVKHFPYDPKLTSDNDEGKGRFGVVLSTQNNDINVIPIMPITSHGKDTERKTYLLRQDEVRLPPNLIYKSNKRESEIYGVIKTERIESFDKMDVTPPLVRLDNNTLLNIYNTYQSNISVDSIKETYNQTMPNHNLIMQNLKENLIARKLGFLTVDYDTNKFDVMRDVNLKVDKIGYVDSLGKHKNIHVYDLVLKTKQEKFNYQISTNLNPKQIANKWQHPKNTKDWLKEDVKYKILNNNVNRDMRNNIRSENKLEKFETFKNRVQEQEKQNKQSQSR